MPSVDIEADLFDDLGFGVRESLPQYHQRQPQIWVHVAGMPFWFYLLAVIGTIFRDDVTSFV
jgi:hypothetical protein